MDCSRNRVVLSGIIRIFLGRGNSADRRFAGADAHARKIRKPPRRHRQQIADGARATDRGDADRQSGGQYRRFGLCHQYSAGIVRRRRGDLFHHRHVDSGDRFCRSAAQNAGDQFARPLGPAAGPSGRAGRCAVRPADHVDRSTGAADPAAVRHPHRRKPACFVGQ